MADENSDILKLDSLLTSLNKENFRLKKEQEFLLYWKEVTNLNYCYDEPLFEIKNRILKTHGIEKVIFYATQRFEEGN